MTAEPMKTPHIQSERRQTMPQAEIKNHGLFVAVLGGLLLLVAMAAPALAVDAVWLSDPGSGEWNTDLNWDPDDALDAEGVGFRWCNRLHRAVVLAGAEATRRDPNLGRRDGPSFWRTRPSAAS